MSFMPSVENIMLLSIGYLQLPITSWPLCTLWHKRRDNSVRRSYINYMKTIYGGRDFTMSAGQAFLCYAKQTKEALLITCRVQPWEGH